MRGSSLIGQNFTAAGYFQGRPSAIAQTADSPLASGGSSNLAASNPALDKAIGERVEALRRANPDASPRVPVELVTASASGLLDIRPDAGGRAVAGSAHRQSPQSERGAGHSAGEQRRRKNRWSVFSANLEIYRS